MFYTGTLFLVGDANLLLMASMKIEPQNMISKNLPDVHCFVFLFRFGVEHLLGINIE